MKLASLFSFMKRSRRNILELQDRMQRKFTWPISRQIIPKLEKLPCQNCKHTCLFQKHKELALGVHVFRAGEVGFCNCNKKWRYLFIWCQDFKRRQVKVVKCKDTPLTWFEINDPASKDWDQVDVPVNVQPLQFANSRVDKSFFLLVLWAV